MSDHELEDNLDSLLNNEYVQSDLEDTDNSVDGYSETESVDLRENGTYQVFSNLLEDDEGKNITNNIKSLNTTHKKELHQINKNLENLNKTIGAMCMLFKSYLKAQHLSNREKKTQVHTQAEIRMKKKQKNKKRNNNSV